MVNLSKTVCKTCKGSGFAIPFPCFSCVENPDPSCCAFCPQCHNTGMCQDIKQYQDQTPSPSAKEWLQENYASPPLEQENKDPPITREKQAESSPIPQPVFSMMAPVYYQPTLAYYQLMPVSGNCSWPEGICTCSPGTYGWPSGTYGWPSGTYGWPSGTYGGLLGTYGGPLGTYGVPSGTCGGPQGTCGWCQGTCIDGMVYYPATAKYPEGAHVWGKYCPGKQWCHKVGCGSKCWRYHSIWAQPCACGEYADDDGIVWHDHILTVDENGEVLARFEGICHPHSLDGEYCPQIGEELLS